MSDDGELLALPPELDGLPDARRREAFVYAESLLPVATIRSTLGEAALDTARVQAAAHWLATTTTATDPRPVHASSASGAWAGSPYGDAVSTILARLPRPSGRGRRLPMAVA